ncbi:unnamed protein product [marine sediment metagenome]|uniref:Uncharacterized protein n=1 Tax=marine sediment metagenome TaxID=412755 RepID=X1QMR0_9ZZZZ
MPDIKEQRYNRLRKLGKELHIPIPEAFLTLEVFDKDGKLIQKHRQRSHSWTRNAYNALFSNLASVDPDDSTFGAGKLSGKDTGGVVKYGAYGASLWYDGTYEGTSYGYRAAAAEDEWGILVGSGENAESFEDFALQTQITQGTGVGEITHIASEAVDKSYGDTTWTHTLVRYFNNNTGANRLINEVALVGIYGRFGHPTGGPYILMSRDKLASTVTVPDTGQLKVTYTIMPLLVTNKVTYAWVVIGAHPSVISLPTSRGTSHASLESNALWRCLGQGKPKHSGESQTSESRHNEQCR